MYGSTEMANVAQLNAGSIIWTAVGLVITVLIILWLVTRMSGSLLYYVKYTALHLYLVLLATVSGIFCIIRPGSSKNIVFPKFFAKFPVMQWIFGISLKAENLEKVNNCEKPCIIISNHQSSIDALIVIAAAPVGSAPLAKKILLYVPIFGLVCWLGGTIFINRKKAQKAIEIMRRVGDEMKEKMTSIWIFPEGTRLQIDTIGTFKKGAFHLAIQAQVPIVPIVISNSRNVLDTCNHKFYGGCIRIKCLEPVKTEGLTSADVDQLIERCHAMMLAEYNKDLVQHKSEYAKLLPVKKKN